MAWYKPIAALLVSAALLVGCGKQKQSGAAGNGAPAGPMVTVAKAEQMSIPIELDVIGNAEPYRTVQVKSMVDGQIAKVLFHQGDDVRTGQLLFQLDKRPFQAALDQASAKLAQDEANLRNNQLNAQRDENLLKEGIIPLQTVQTQETQAASDSAAVQADKAAIEAAKVNLGYTDIRAPIAARAGAILVDLGNLVKANDTNPLVTLNQITPLYVQFNVPEANLQAVRAKGIGRLQVKALPPGSSDGSMGTLTFIDNSVDANTGTIRLMATFPNRQRRLWPGEFLNVQLTLGVDPHALVIPATAVQDSQQGKYVFVVQADGTAVMRVVNTPRTYRQLSVIASGIKPGDEVIVAGQVRVIPNSKVNVVKTVPVAPAPEQVAQDGNPAASGVPQ
jgi:multidrug efflux system membrane fusion protein